MRKIIYEGETGILWKRGVIAKVLKPGLHRYSLLLGSRVEVFSVQPTDIVCETQQYSTKDNLIVRFSMSGQYKIVDPILYRKNVSEESRFRLVQTILVGVARKIIASNTLDDILAEANKLDEKIIEQARKKIDGLGIEILIVAPISVLIPRSLSQAYEAEVYARKKAIADLEEARGRTVVLRHLANAAEMVEKRPVLLQLLMGQKARQVQFQFNDREKK